MKGLIFLCLQLVAVLPIAAQGLVYVEVKSSTLRSEPKYWASALVELPYGTALTKLSEQEDWVRVKAAGFPEGFIHRSAVTSRTVILSSARPSDQAISNSADVVLAGKGFTAEIEKQYRLDNPGDGYDRLEKALVLTISDRELAEFSRSGKLRESAR